MGQVENMKKLGMTDEEIADVLACDSAIEKSKNENPIFPWEMSVEEHKKAVKAANSDEKQKKTPKKVAKDDKKANLLVQIANFLGGITSFVGVNEPTNEIFFTFEGEKYAIKLRKTRK